MHVNERRVFAIHSRNYISAESIANHILICVARLELDVNNCVGQCYDGAASMSGHVSGVQTRIQEKESTANHVQCASHCLNSVLNTS